MTQRTFLTQLSGVSLLVALLLSAFYIPDGLKPYWGLGVAGWGLFTVVTCLMFFLGKRTVHSRNPNDFTRVVLGTMAFKMLLTITLAFIYYQLVRPTSKYAVVPFLLVYVVFTVYETYLLTVLGAPEKNAND